LNPLSFLRKNTMKNQEINRAGITKGRSGFTLLEVLITIVILVLALFPLVQIMSSGLLAGLESEATAHVMNLAQMKMEEIKDTSFANIVSQSKQGFPGHPGYSYAITVNQPETGLKEVSVVMYWWSGRDETSVALDTIIIDQ